MSPETTPPDPQGRGSALVLALIFLLVGSMLALAAYRGADTAQRSQRESLSAQRLQLALRSGVADALNELQTGVDSDGDGLGAIGTGLPGADAAGREMRASTGTLLARYRTTIDTTSAPGRTILRVVAAIPDFATPRQVVSCQLELSRGGWLPTDNAVVFSLPEASLPSSYKKWLADGADPTKKDAYKWGPFELGRHALVRIVDPRAIGDPTQGTEALRMTNKKWADLFLTVFDDARLGVRIQGSGPPSGRGWDTTTTEAGGRVGYAELKALADSVTDYVRTTPATTTILDPGTSGSHLDLKTFPDPGDAWPDGLKDVGGVGQVVRLGAKDDTLEISGVTLQGSGTLIVDRKLELKKGGRLVWDGDVIVFSDATKKAELKIHGGELAVRGNLVLVADPDSRSEVKLHVHGKRFKKGGRTSSWLEYGSFLNVEGALVALSVGSRKDGTAQGKVKIDIREGGKRTDLGAGHVNIDGLFALLGTELDFKLQGGKVDEDSQGQWDWAEDPGLLAPDVTEQLGQGEETSRYQGIQFRARGSVVFGVPADIDPDKLKNVIKKFQVKGRSRWLARYDPDAVEEAVSGLRGFFDRLPNPPLLTGGGGGSGSWKSVGTYLEVPGQAGLAEQEATLRAAREAGELLGLK